jgi:hypothetical protein
VTDSSSKLPRSVGGKNSFENKRITRSIFPEKERDPWNSHESFASSLMTKKEGDPTPSRVAASMMSLSMNSLREISPLNPAVITFVVCVIVAC